MKKYILGILLIISFIMYSQNSTSPTFKKRVLESTEVDFLASYYTQDGSRSSVSGGIGSEKLTDIASNIVIAMPMNDDDVLTVDVGISAYSSASSSNINPFNSSGASRGNYDDDDDDRNGNSNQNSTMQPYGSPWQASSGASKSDQLVSVMANYSHSSNSRNFIWNADVSFSNEYDYTSMGFGGGIASLFNEKNTEVSLKVNTYLDQWRPIYPTELHEYSKYGSNFLSQGYFNGVSIYNQNSVPTNEGYLPSKFHNLTITNRNSYSASFGFSQILSKRLQLSIFFDLLKQQGLLSTPYHRIYFADKNNFFIGQSQFIPNYESPDNNGVYKLADDIERLPNTRFKIPIGTRINYYINEFLILRTYYRYYSDDWNIHAHTANIELPVKLSDKFTVFPSFRYYKQTASKFFAPYETHLSSEQYYTSDPDLATFTTKQIGFGVNYTDIFASARIWHFGLKNVDFRFNQYNRTDKLKASIATFAFKFIMQ
jgi:hypothetical protein